MATHLKNSIDRRNIQPMMPTRRYFSAFSFCLLLLFLLGMLVSVSFPRQNAKGASIEILPAPLYPSDGQVDHRYPDQYVFFDDNMRDLVLAYRTTPGSPRTIHRIKRPPAVAPEIVATVSKNRLGDFRYRYRLTNGRAAGQPIREWYLSIPEPKPVDLTSSGRFLLRDKEKPGQWEQRVYSFYPGAWTVHFAARPGALLTPNKSAEFVVDNENRPGMVESYFRGDVTSVDSLPDDLPPEVRTQLDGIIGQQGWGREVVLTIGPKFHDTVTSNEIAVDFYTNFHIFVRQGVLTKGSPFVQEVLARLAEFIRRPRQWSEEEYFSLAINEPFPPISQPPDPLSSAEQQLSNALRLALVRP